MRSNSASPGRKGSYDRDERRKDDRHSSQRFSSKSRSQDRKVVVNEKEIEPKALITEDVQNPETKDEQPEIVEEAKLET